MPELVERIDVDAPPERVWAVLTDWERQGEWMLATDVGRWTAPAQRLHGRLAARTGLPLPGGRHVGVARHHDHHEVGAAAAGRGAAHRPDRARARASSRSSPAASTRRSSGPSGWYLPYGYLGVVGWFFAPGWSGACGSRCSGSSPGPALLRVGIRRSLRRFAAVAACPGRHVGGRPWARMQG